MIYITNVVAMKATLILVEKEIVKNINEKRLSVRKTNDISLI